MTCDELVDHAAEPARVDRGGIELPGGVCAEQQTNQHRREVGVLSVAVLAIGKPVEQPRQLGHDFLVQSGESLAKLRSPERGDPDLREENAALAVGGIFDEQEVEPARERALGIEHVELCTERRTQILDDLLHGRDQQIFLRYEVMMDESCRKARFGCDPLDRRLGDPVLQDRGPEAFDDLTSTRSGEARASHRLVGY